MKNQYGQKDLAGALQARQQRQENGKELRAAHFDMGQYAPMYQESEKYMKLKGPTQQIAQFIPVNPARNQHTQSEAILGSANKNQMTNFTTEHTKQEIPNQFISLNKQAAD